MSATFISSTGCRLNGPSTSQLCVLRMSGDASSASDHEHEREHIQSPHHPLRIEYRADIHKERSDDERYADDDPDDLENKKMERYRGENDQARRKQNSDRKEKGYHGQRSAYTKI